MEKASNQLLETHQQDIHGSDELKNQGAAPMKSNAYWAS